MKKLMLALVFTAMIAVTFGFPSGWEVTGQIKVVKKSPGSTYGHWSVSGYGIGGTISQSVYVPAGQYVMAVWCNGNGIFTLSNGNYSETKQCDPSKRWPSLTFVSPALSNGVFTVSAKLRDGDRADMFCLYSASIDEGGCPPSLFINPSFEQ